MALKKNALDPAEREKECTHELGFSYSGRIPNTGPKVCYMCGTREDDVLLFYRTVIQIEVLSRGQLPDGISLSGVEYAITEGDCSGNFHTIQEEAVNGPTMARLLYDQGSEPMFLGLTEEGLEA